MPNEPVLESITHITYVIPVRRFFHFVCTHNSNISEGQSLNRYAYVNGNPVSYVDPFGLSRDSDSYDYFLENTITALAESVYHDTIGTFEAILNYEETIKGIEDNIKNFSFKNAAQSMEQYVVEFACADSDRQAEMTGQLLSGFVGGPINKVNRFVPKRVWVKP